MNPEPEYPEPEYPEPEYPEPECPEPEYPEPEGPGRVPLGLGAPRGGLQRGACPMASRLSPGPPHPALGSAGSPGA